MEKPFVFEEQEQTYEFTDFTSLECWKESRDLRKDISVLVKSFPDIEKKRLSDQMIRASRSITNNIAEGSGRYHFKDSIKFMFQARGSLFELKDHLLIAHEENLIETEVQNEQLDRLNRSGKLLSGYIKYLIGMARKYNKQDYMK